MALATIQRISEVFPIDGADRIEGIRVKGWELVSKKGEFQKGDYCVFFEINSILPDHKVFEFMRSRKFRVKTAKFQKQISQGLALPVSIMQHFVDVTKHWEVDTDMTDTIGVKKHDPEAVKERQLMSNCDEYLKSSNVLIKFMIRFNWFRKMYFSKNKLRKFPTQFISKSDEPNVQNSLKVLSAMTGKSGCVIETEKMEGQSATYIFKPKKKWWHRDEYLVCSRNLVVIDPRTTYMKISEKLKIKEVLKEICIKQNLESIALQGEICGPGIQKNIYSFPELEFYAFKLVSHVKDNDKTIAIDEHFFKMEVLLAKYGIKCVPKISMHNFVDMDIGMGSREWLKWLVERSKRISPHRLNDKGQEGSVFKCYNTGCHFKVKNPEYYLEKGE